MAMVFCRGCGKEIHESAPACPQCGAPQSTKSTVVVEAIPDGVKGWSWGAFLFNFIWAIANKTWIGLLVLVPGVGFIMAIILGFNGREWAWKNKQWDSVEHFNRVQKKWSQWAVGIILVSFFIGILAAIVIPAYRDYQHRAQEVAQAKQIETERLANEAQELEAKHLADIAATNAITDFSGTYVKENAEIEVKQTGQIVNFSINSVVGQNSCNLEGRAVVMGSLSTSFSAASSTDDKSNKCIARFDLASSGLTVITKDCDGYCGMNAEGSMDGLYQKK
ncbi:MAG: hypothetical protein RL358_1638 [Pseudomonadota bacterium]|jgi:Tfp pilus assembly protein PilE